jgi:hypothetical protein
MQSFGKNQARQQQLFSSVAMPTNFRMEDQGAPEMNISIAKGFIEIPDIWGNWQGFAARLDKNAIISAKKESFTLQWVRNSYAHNSCGLQSVVDLILRHNLQMRQHFYSEVDLFTDSFCFVDTTTRGHMSEDLSNDAYNAHMAKHFPDMWQGPYASSQESCILVGAFHRRVLMLTGRINDESFDVLARSKGLRKTVLVCLRFIRASVLAIV